MKKTAFLTSACFILTLFVFAPVSVFLINQEEIYISFTTLIVFLIPAALIFSTLFGIVLLSLNARLRTKMISLAIAVSFLLWFQGNILAWHYGQFDGMPIPWNRYWVLGLIDTPVWILGIALALGKPERFYRAAGAIAGFIILVQIISVTTSFVRTQRDSHSFKQYNYDESAKFDFSKKTNVILLVLDEFQSDIFQEIIESDKEYAEIFDGFTYFRNALSASNHTHLALQAVFTGRLYDNSQKRSEFLKKTFLEASLLKVLDDSGFTINLFPLEGRARSAMYIDKSICSNLKKRDLTFVTSLKDTLLICDLALFRYLPHFAKKYVYNDNKWLLVHALQYVQEIKLKHFMAVPEFDVKQFMDAVPSRSRFEKADNVFMLYHLYGLHPPMRLNEKLEVFKQLPLTRETYTGQAKACLKMCKAFFEVLKKNRSYDQSLIMVIGDHGCGQTQDLYVEPMRGSREAIPDRRACDGSFQRDKARGIPLVLVKPFNARGRVMTSDAPVSLIDVPQTVLSELKIKADLPGISMFNVPHSRKRLYGAYKLVQWETDFVQPITLYAVDGFSWSNDSWDIQAVLKPGNSSGLSPAGYSVRDPDQTSRK